MLKGVKVVEESNWAQLWGNWLTLIFWIYGKLLFCNYKHVTFLWITVDKESLYILYSLNSKSTFCCKYFHFSVNLKAVFEYLKAY